MNNLNYLVFFAVLMVVSLLYFRIARHFGIVDLPNHRTMHHGATIRGGGAVIPLAMIATALLLNFPGYYFIAGMLLVAIVGFVDDLKNLPGSLRFPFQVIAIVLILLDLNFLSIPWAALAVLVVVATGALNAFNFMDGINGLTVGYSLILVATLVFINSWIMPFTQSGLLDYYFIALLVFAFFNFRDKAVCFAGDVGSLSVAYVNIYLMLTLIYLSGQWIFVFFLSLYGIDTIFTIIQRLMNRENIFEAHNKHLFQLAVREMGFSHLQMTGIYMLIQLIVNVLIIFMLPLSVFYQVIALFLMLGTLSLAYIFIKLKLLKKAI